MDLSEKEVDEEIVAIKSVMTMHEEGVKQNAQGIKVNKLILELIETYKNKTFG